MLEHVRGEAHVCGRVGKRKLKSISDYAPARYGAARCHRDPMGSTSRLSGHGPFFARLKSSYIRFHEDTPGTSRSECIRRISDATTDIEHECTSKGNVMADLPHCIVRQQAVEVVWVGLFRPESLEESYGTMEAVFGWHRALQVFANRGDVNRVLRHCCVHARLPDLVHSEHDEPGFCAATRRFDARLGV